RIVAQPPQRRREERAALEDAESAARRDFGCDRRAGFEKGRRWRGSLPVLRGEGGPDEFGCLACVGVRQRAKDKLGRRFGVPGDGIANLHARMYKTVARLEGKGGKFPQPLRASWTKFNPCFRSASRLRLVFAALAGEDRSGAVHRAKRA